MNHSREDGWTTISYAKKCKTANIIFAMIIVQLPLIHAFDDIESRGLALLNRVTNERIIILFSTD